MDNFFEKIDEVFIETMSEMGFIDIITVKDHTIIKKPVCVKIGILMPFLHDIYIQFSPNLAREISANILGSDFDEGQINDAIGEFANVFAGKMLDRLSPHLLFELGYPEIMLPPNDQPPKDYKEHHYITPAHNKVILFRKFENID